MKSYTLGVEGAKTVLQLSDEPLPEPGPGQVLLKMHAAALNRGEFIPGGLIKSGVVKPAGIEGAGEVFALGSGVTNLAIGQRVMGRCAAAFSEYAVMDAREALPVPAGLTMEAAAALPLAPPDRRRSSEANQPTAWAATSSTRGLVPPPPRPRVAGSDLLRGGPPLGRGAGGPPSPTTS